MVIEQEKLDDLEEIKTLDPSEMWKRMKTVPEQIMSAGEQVSNIVLPAQYRTCLLYTSPSPRDLSTSRMPSSA